MRKESPNQRAPGLGHSYVRSPIPGVVATPIFILESFDSISSDPSHSTSRAVTRRSCTLHDWGHALYIKSRTTRQLVARVLAEAVDSATRYLCNHSGKLETEVRRSSLHFDRFRSSVQHKPVGPSLQAKYADLRPTHPALHAWTTWHVALGPGPHSPSLLSHASGSSRAARGGTELTHQNTRRASPTPGATTSRTPARSHPRPLGWIRHSVPQSALSVAVRPIGIALVIQRGTADALCAADIPILVRIFHIVAPASVERLLVLGHEDLATAHP